MSTNPNPFELMLANRMESNASSSSRKDAMRWAVEGTFTLHTYYPQFMIKSFICFVFGIFARRRWLMNIRQTHTVCHTHTLSWKIIRQTLKEKEPWILRKSTLSSCTFMSIHFLLLVYICKAPPLSIYLIYSLSLSHFCFISLAQIFPIIFFLFSYFFSIILHIRDTLLTACER